MPRLFVACEAATPSVTAISASPRTTRVIVSLASCPRRVISTSKPAARKDFAAQLRVIHQLPPPSMLESLSVSTMSPPLRRISDAFRDRFGESARVRLAAHIAGADVVLD